MQLKLQIYKEISYNHGWNEIIKKNNAFPILLKLKYDENHFNCITIYLECFLFSIKEEIGYIET